MNWFNKLLGKKEEVVQEETNVQTTEEVRRQALEKEKQEATAAGKAWISVIDTQVNPANIKNGFFELDWNNQFIEELLDAGYKGETNEQIVDAWFRTIVVQMLQEEGLDPERGAGYINVVPIDKNKSSVS
jgi:NADH:ubiquinone oxidoreductase subunit